MGGGPPGHIEEVLDRQRDAVKRRQVLGRGGPHYRIGCGRRGLADIVVGAVAERVQLRVELIYPVEVAIGHLDRAHLLAAYRRGKLDRRGERVNRVAHHELSLPVRVPGASVVARRRPRLGRMSRRRATTGGARTMAACDLPSRFVPPRLCGTSRSRHGRADWRESGWPDSARGPGTWSTCRW